MSLVGEVEEGEQRQDKMVLTIATLGLEDKFILEEKSDFEDGSSGLLKSDLTNHPPTLTWIVTQQPLARS